MPSMINIGMVNVSTPQQNAAGAMFGEMSISGWDANMKMNLGEGGLFGVLCVVAGVVNFTWDGMEVADGNIFDQDLKAQFAVNF
ncbi:hypothetical protein [Alicyclobacillus sp. ALC3]|uniref:hypothetical protein n=1 Tax=Alicyclobacillus sp. ALC3 TaxID=2796143 RepID=UPI0023793E7C|nr:hypothetical protein [Alicyclobacillus sp. ALC3]WDL96853.1 hypothetical protein JC200_21610 [Alicyclobacillus sp. ALC3]